MNLQQLREDLIDDEGLSTHPYKDSKEKITIGVGHNLTDKGLKKKFILELLDDDIQDAIAQTRLHIVIFDQLDDARQRVLVNMCFNLGSFYEWPHFVHNVNTRNFTGAADEMRKSLWHKQVGKRAIRLENMMLDGDN